MPKEIRQASPMIALLVALLLLGVGYSIYRAVGSFSEDRSSPAYERSPSPAFAIPVPDTIVEPQKLNESRLPDQAAVELAARSRQLTKRIANQTISKAALQKIGARPDQIGAMMTAASAYYPLYEGREIQIDNRVIVGLVSVDAASLSQSFSYGASADGTPGGSITVTYRFAIDPAAGVYTLEAIETN